MTTDGHRRSPGRAMAHTVRATDVAVPVRVPKAAELVAARLRGQIVRGELAEGDALPPEHELMHRFGVSRPTLREAFRVLEREALLSVQRGARGGARVHAPDGDVAARYAGLVLQFRGATIADVYEARRALELAAVPVVGRGLAAGQLAVLEDNVAAMRAATDPSAIIELHDEFHRLLLEMAGSHTLGLFEEMTHHIVELHGRYRVGRRPPVEVWAGGLGGARTHAKLVELIRARDSDEAVVLWRRHLDEVTRLMLLDDDTTVLDLLG
jgi:GntR family transcriptional regulator, transcriptional repressor for pyruvate dehydrogenase complex